MPELSEIKPYSLPSLVFTPINPASYQKTDVPQMPSDRRGLAQAGMWQSIAGSLGQIPQTALKSYEFAKKDALAKDKLALENKKTDAETTLATKHGDYWDAKTKELNRNPWDGVNVQKYTPAANGEPGYHADEPLPTASTESEELGKVTSFGYQGDQFGGPTAKSSTVGAWGTPLDSQSMAVSPDVEQRLKAAGVKPMDMVQVKLADGTAATRRWDDRTAQDDQVLSGKIKGVTKPLRGRWDFHAENGTASPHADKQVVGFAPATQAAVSPVAVTSAAAPSVAASPVPVGDNLSVQPADLTASINGAAPAVVAARAKPLSAVNLLGNSVAPITDNQTLANVFDQGRSVAGMAPLAGIGVSPKPLGAAKFGLPVQSPGAAPQTVSEAPAEETVAPDAPTADSGIGAAARAAGQGVLAQVGQPTPTVRPAQPVDGGFIPVERRHGILLNLNNGNHEVWENGVMKGMYPAMNPKKFVPMKPAAAPTPKFIQRQNPDGTTSTMAINPQTLEVMKDFDTKMPQGKKYASLQAAKDDLGAAAVKDADLLPDGSVIVRKISGSQTDEEARAEAIAADVMTGNQTPDLMGIPRSTKAIVMQKLHDNDYNLKNAQMDFMASKKWLTTANGTQQLRMRQSIDNAYHQLGVIEDLAKQWKAGKYPLLNTAQIALAKQGGLGSEAQSLATIFEAQINDLTSELANVYMGGNSPTTHAMEIAASNLKANYSEKTILDSINQIRTNLEIRNNSIKNSGPITMQDVKPDAAANPAKTSSAQITQMGKAPAALTPQLSALKADYEAGKFDADPQRKALAEQKLKQYGLR